MWRGTEEKEQEPDLAEVTKHLQPDMHVVDGDNGDIARHGEFLAREQLPGLLHE